MPLAKIMVTILVLKRRSDIQFCDLQGSSMIALLMAGEGVDMRRANRRHSKPCRFSTILVRVAFVAVKCVGADQVTQGH